VEEAANLVESLVTDDGTYKGPGKSSGSSTEREVKS
jgi:hypothetical protein